MITNLTFNMPVTFNCWDVVKNLNPEAKRSLIVALQKSLDESEDLDTLAEDDDSVIDYLSMSWPDDGMSADDFVHLCESGRNVSRSIVEL